MVGQPLLLPRDSQHHIGRCRGVRYVGLATTSPNKIRILEGVREDGPLDHAQYWGEGQVTYFHDV